MKDLLKGAVAETKRLTGELATVKTTIPAPEALEELETLRKTNSELKERVEAFYLDSDPEVIKPLKEAQDGFWDFMVKDPRLQLPETRAAELRDLDPNGKEGAEELAELLDKVEKLNPRNRLLEMELGQRIMGYQQAHRDHGKRLEELRSKRGDFEKERGEQQVKEQQQWANDAAAELREQAKEASWWGKKSGTTPEDLAHNKRFDEEVAPQLQAGITAMWTKDTKGAMKVVFKALAHDQVAKERDELKTKLADAEKRIEELDADAKGVQRISKPSRTEITNPEKQKAPIETHTDRETGVDEAFEQWRASRA
jgi:small-conductance mechanosensitive channel